jgi:hypothetical protein
VLAELPMPRFGNLDLRSPRRQEHHLEDRWEGRLDRERWRLPLPIYLRAGRVILLAESLAGW